MSNLNIKEDNKTNNQTNTINNGNTNETFKKNETVLLKEENKISDNSISETEIKFSSLKKLDNNLVTVSNLFVK